MTDRPGAAYIDATAGVAGDMLLAALLDAGADEETIRSALALLPVEPVSVRTERVRRHGFRALRVHVDAPESRVPRTPRDIAAIVTGARLPQPAAGVSPDTPFGQIPVRPAAGSLPPGRCRAGPRCDHVCNSSAPG